MAVSGVSSTKSIYGNRNVITGLASGMDTESMIENVISSYKNKISQLTQKRTKTEWKQESYRSIIDKMSVFTDKYASYRSSNNLMSTSFFNQAVKTTAKGKYADKITATGRSSSDIQVDRVRQLATAATYKLSGSKVDAGTASFGSSSITAAAGGSFNLEEEMTISSFSGNLTLAYGGSNALSYLTIEFDESKTYEDAYDLTEEINRQLKEQTVTIGNNSYTGDELLNKVVRAEFNADGEITFVDPKHNNVYISSASASVKANLLGGQELSSEYENQVKSIQAGDVGSMKETMSTYDYLTKKGANLEITLDGVTKSIVMPTIDPEITDKKAREEEFIKNLQAKINTAFGTDANGKPKLAVSDANSGDGIQLQFTAKQNGSTFSVSSSKGEVLGFGEGGKVTSFLNTSKTLGELLSEKNMKIEQFEVAYAKNSKGNDIYEVDDEGNLVHKLATDKNGKQLYSFRVNGEEVGQFNEDTSLSEVMNAMNSNSDCGVKVGYSKLTNELTFTAKDTGASSRIDFNNPTDDIEGDSLSAALFGMPKSYDGSSGTYTEGKDAILEVTVNGTSLGEIRRSTNSVELDGMTINLKGTFGYEANEDGSVKYQQKTNANGALVFSYGNGRELYAKARPDDSGILDLKDKNNNAIEYSSTNSSNPLNGAKIYAKAGTDGKLSYYAKDDSGKEQQLYARMGSNGNLWFSVNNQDAVDVKPVMDHSTAVKTSGSEPVTFETTSDSAKIVEVVKSMVADYNAMITEIKKAYSTLPNQRSNGAYYEPLTDEDKEGMSESTIENWEAKAKEGILFGDSDLSNLYRRLTSAISMTGENGAVLRSAGITVKYSNGLSTLDFDEDKFRAALDKDPEKVRDAFTSSMENGSRSNGLMQALKTPLDMYGKTSGGKGILVDKAGSPLAASTLYTNRIQKELDSIDTEIEKWQDKMSDQVDYYTNQFSKLEQLIQQMNSQSSYFSQLMGG